MSVIFFFGACDLIKMKKEEDDIIAESDPVARVHQQYLYPEDLEGITPVGMSAEDSTERVERFINNWIHKQLLIDKASTEIEFDQAEIERKILDYKYSLMGYEYRAYIVNQKLSTEVDEQEIQDYYQANIDNFILKQNIIRGKFIKLPQSAPRINKVKQLINSSEEEDLDELNSYCLSFATTYQMDDSVWMVFDDVVKNSPLAEIPNKIQFLKNTKYVETTDEFYVYYLKVNEFRISDNVSPLEFVREDIKNIIINKRKVELAKQLENDVYESASKNNEFEIYN